MFYVVLLGDTLVFYWIGGLMPQAAAFRGFPKFRDNAENDSPVRVRTYPGSVSYDDYELVIVPRVPS